MKLFGAKKRDSDEEYIQIINKANEEHDAIIAKALAEKDEILKEVKKILQDLKEQHEQIEAQALSDVRNQKREIEQDLQQMQEEMRELERLSNTYAANPWEGFDLTNTEYAEKIRLIKEQVRKLIENGRAAENTAPFETNEQIKEYKRRYTQIIKCFCAEADLISIEAKTKSFGVVNRKIAKSYQDINKLFEKDNIKISELLLELKTQQCIAIYFSHKK